MTRRAFTATLAALPASLAAAPTGPGPKSQMGLGTASCFNRARADKGFAETLNFIEYARGLGFGGVQAGLTESTREYANKVRRACDQAGMYYEVSARLPRTDSDLEDFKDLVRAAKVAGASVIRTVLFSGRRYENHDTYETFDEARKNAWKMVTLAEPILRKQRMKIAIENHKNFRGPDLLEVMRRIQSEHVGITFDFGNNYVLMEDPVELAQALAPYAYSAHIKDHRLQPYEEGFLLLDAAMGTGVIDIARVMSILRGANPDIRFTLETMTRDALRVPYLTDKYWATFKPIDLPGRDLAKTLRTVRDANDTKPFPEISAMSKPDVIALEEENNITGLRYAQDSLGL